MEEFEEKGYLVIGPDGLVENFIVWNGVSEYSPGEGRTLELPPANSYCSIGMYKQEDGLFYHKWSDGTFSLEPEKPTV